MIPGFAKRLEIEITKLAPPRTKIRIITDSNGQDAPWIGGSIRADLSYKKNTWIYRRKYEEYGAAVVHKKCPSNWK